MSSGFDRRTLLLSGIGLGTLGRIPWIDQAFRGAQGDPSQRRILHEACSLAKARGMPVLVFVVPEEFDRHERGRAIGTYLELAGSGALADLALCEVVCAKLSELRSLVHGMTIRFEGEPMAVLVDWGRNDVRAAVQSSPRLPSDPNPFGRSPEEVLQREEKLIRWTEVLSGEIHSVIAPDRSEVLRRAEEARARIPGPERERFASHVASGKAPTAVEASVCPAWALSVATTRETLESTVVLLSDVARSRLVDRSPRGARWAKEGPCADYKLEDPSEHVWPGPCGTGVLPPASRRFLWLFTKTDR